MKRSRFTLVLTLLFCLGNTYSQTWNLVWSDEFNYSGSPDAASWNMENWTPGWVNDEDQAYTDRLENARVENGNLIIEARKDNYNGWEWTSARIQTANKHDALYGRIEVRAILPVGGGTWPAIWMLPTDWIYGGWPTCGEIDIMEHIGNDLGNVHASVHTESYNHTINTQVSSQISISDASSAYHVYAIEWSPDEIKMFVDDNNYFTFQNERSGYQAWPFDKPFHLILNVAMGGSWGGRINRKLTSAQMTVDYVRAYTSELPVDTEAPTIPPSLSGTPSSSSVNLSWEPSTDNYSVKEYEVYQNNTFIGTTIWHNFYVNGLDALTSYSFKVLARDYNGNESGFTSADISTIDIIVNNIPAKIEAEDFNAQFGVQTEATSDDGGGENVGWIDTGDWLEYFVGVATAGDFVVDYRYSSLNGGGEIQLQNETGDVLATTAIPATGDWQAWSTISSSSFSLPSGANQIRLYTSAGGYNLNWLEFRSVPLPGDDTESPTEPTNLATAATATTIDLTWEASTDNVAVAGYKVFLDGALIGSTHNLNYQITDLTKRSGYSIGVNAFDAAGNESVVNTVNTRTKPKSAIGTGEISQKGTTFRVYPNPVQDQLAILFNGDFIGGSLNLFDMSGKNVLTLSNILSENINIDMSQFSNGIYILQLIGKNNIQTQRIIKE